MRTRKRARETPFRDPGGVTRPPPESSALRRAACTALFALGALSPPPQAQAVEATRVLVSNIGQTANAGLDVGNAFGVGQGSTGTGGSAVAIGANHKSLPLSLLPLTDDLTFTLEREGGTTDELQMTVTLAQDEFLPSDTRLAHTVTFAAGAGGLGVEMAWGTDLGAWRHGAVGTAYGRVSGQPDVEDLRLGWRVAPDTGKGGGMDHDFWLEPGVGGGWAGVGVGLNWAEDRTGVRSSMGVDLSASEAGGAKAGIRQAWEW